MTLKAVWGFVVAAVVLLLAPAAFAQTTITPGSPLRLHFDLTGDQATVDAQTVNLYADALPAVPVPGKVCSGPGADAGTIHCVAPIPALTQGNHVLAVTALLSGMETPKSNSVSVIFLILVTPGHFQIVDLAEFRFLPRG